MIEIQTNIEGLFIRVIKDLGRIKKIDIINPAIKSKLKGNEPFQVIADGYIDMNDNLVLLQSVQLSQIKNENWLKEIVEFIKSLQSQSFLPEFTHYLELNWDRGIPNRYCVKQLNISNEDGSGGIINKFDVYDYQGKIGSLVKWIKQADGTSYGFIINGCRFHLREEEVQLTIKQ